MKKAMMAFCWRSLDTVAPTVATVEKGSERVLRAVIDSSLKAFLAAASACSRLGIPFPAAEAVGEGVKAANFNWYLETGD